MEDTALTVGGLVFLAISILHLLRFILKIEVKIASWIMPLWLSVLGFLGFVILAFWMFVA